MSNNLLKGIIALLVCIFGSYVFVNPPTGKQLDNSMTKTAYPSFTMPKLVVHNMINNYKENQLVAIEHAPKNAVQNDAQAIWFDLKKLKSFIETVESKAPKENNGLGIRFYYAAYPEESQFNKLDFDGFTNFSKDFSAKKYARKHTLILIPTIKLNGINTDFEPEESKGTSSTARMALNHGDVDL